MQREKLFVDSSVVLSSLFYPESNSRLVLDLLAKGGFDAFVSEKVVEEVKEVVLLKKGERDAYLAQRLLLRLFTLVKRSEVTVETQEWRGKIKEKDLEHLATAKKLGCKIIAFDKDFASFKEYATPKQFVKKLGLKPFETDY